MPLVVVRASAPLTASSRKRVEVSQGDWGDVVAQCTRERGVMYVLLAAPHCCYTVVALLLHICYNVNQLLVAVTGRNIGTHTADTLLLHCFTNDRNNNTWHSIIITQQSNSTTQHSHVRRYAALNMANAYSPGGGYTDGMVAQEENMYILHPRETVHLIATTPLFKYHIPSLSMK
jgi:hypothetical protein